MNIPEIIAEQMGGKPALRMMLGAHSFAAPDDRTLEFRFAARALDRINMVRVKLDPSDTYSVVFVRAWKNGVKEYRYSDIYCDQLGELFERRTGLVLRPPRFVRIIGSANV